MAPFLIIMSSMFGTAILTEAGLSFLGLGIEPPTPSWGGMLTGQAAQFLRTAPWMLVFPGLALSLTVLGFAFAGDALRDILDPGSGGGSRRNRSHPHPNPLLSFDMLRRRGSFMERPVKSIDIHAHLTPQCFIQAMNRGEEWHGVKPGTMRVAPRAVWTPEQRLNDMNSLGVDVHVVSTGAAFYFYDQDRKSSPRCTANATRKSTR